MLYFTRLLRNNIDPTISDNNEPPPSYQDAVSVNDDNSPMSPRDVFTDVFTGDDHLSLKHHTQDCIDEKSTTLNPAYNEFQLPSKEGASAPEQWLALPATFPRDDRNFGESTPPPTEAEDLHGMCQKTSSVVLRYVKI